IDRLVFFLDVDRLPLPRACRAFLQFPVVVEQQVEIPVIPFGGMGGPGTFNTTGDGIATFTLTLWVVPSQTLFGEISSLRVGSELGGIAITVTFANRVT